MTSRPPARPARSAARSSTATKPPFAHRGQRPTARADPRPQPLDGDRPRQRPTQAAGDPRRSPAASSTASSPTKRPPRPCSAIDRPATAAAPGRPIFPQTVLPGLRASAHLRPRPAVSCDICPQEQHLPQNAAIHRRKDQATPFLLLGAARPRLRCGGERPGDLDRDRNNQDMIRMQDFRPSPPRPILHYGLNGRRSRRTSSRARGRRQPTYRQRPVRHPDDRQLRSADLGQAGLADADEFDAAAATSTTTCSRPSAAA